MDEHRSRTHLGRTGEAEASAFLIAAGYRILERNVRYRAGEIDLVAEEGGYLVFVEVKTRRNARYGTAAEAVTPAKQQQLVRLAGIYLAGLGGEIRPCRFDVVTVEPAPGGGWQCALIRDAFSAN